MDKETRLGLLVLVIAIAAWRFARYMRFGLSRSRRPTNLGVAGGLVPQDADRTASVTDLGSSAPAQSSLDARVIGVIVAVGLWLAINALLWYCLLELPPFKDLPPIPVGVAGIFSNFYGCGSFGRHKSRCKSLVRVVSVWTKMAVFAILARQTADILYSWSTKIPAHVGARHGERRYNRQEGCFYT